MLNTATVLNICANICNSYILAGEDSVILGLCCAAVINIAPTNAIAMLEQSG